MNDGEAGIHSVTISTTKNSQRIVVPCLYMESGCKWTVVISVAEWAKIGELLLNDFKGKVIYARGAMWDLLNFGGGVLAAPICTTCNPIEGALSESTKFVDSVNTENNRASSEGGPIIDLRPEKFR